MNEEQITKYGEPSSNEVLVRVEGVSKIFCRSLKRSLHYGLMDSLSDILPVGKRKKDESGEPILREQEFWAVKDISFELRRGERLGLIGRNGAGKTTLLKMLNGLIKPDKGRIEMRGRVGALIALGAGFNPILTGRENIYVNGSILGLSKKEIEDKIDEIIDFSEIREFIDSPVQSYSSGMAVRLGFAIATALNPDILLLDEVLAVGDYSFRIKCLNRISELARKTTVLFVSHSADQVRWLCDLALYLDKGQQKYLGQVAEAFNLYEVQTSGGIAAEYYLHPTLQDPKIVLATAEAEFRRPLRLQIHCKSLVDYRRLIIRVIFTTITGEPAAEWSSADYDHFYDMKAGKPATFEIEIPSLMIRPGMYSVSYALTSENCRDRLIKAKDTVMLKVTGPSNILHLRPL
jgi:lipopolysaccharide transport system ATP-binding protein